MRNNVRSAYQSQSIIVMLILMDYTNALDDLKFYHLFAFNQQT